MIVTEASLSFLGLGIRPPTPTWGGMLSDARNYMQVAWWLPTFPGVALLLAVWLAVNLVGDGLPDTLDPTLRDGGRMIARTRVCHQTDPGPYLPCIRVFRRGRRADGSWGRRRPECGRYGMPRARHPCPSPAVRARLCFIRPPSRCCMAPAALAAGARAVKASRATPRVRPRTLVILAFALAAGQVGHGVTGCAAHAIAGKCARRH